LRRKNSALYGQGFFVCLFSLIGIGQIEGIPSGWARAGIEENSTSAAIMGKMAQLILINLYSCNWT
jgi:hypothetical protein